MPQYMMTYLGGDHPSTPEEGQRHFARYMEWLSALGEAAVSPMNPLGNTRCLHPDGTVSDGSSCAMSGYTILEAESMDAALEMARSCPFLEIGGSLEVAEMMQMPGAD